jgi:predicted PurR-regulated permease PerM
MGASREVAVRVSAWRWIRAAAVVATFWIGFQLLLIAQHWLLDVFSVVVYVVFGGVLALVAWPAVDALEARRVPRGAAIAIVLVGGSCALFGLGYFVGTELVAEGRSLLNQLPGWVARLERFFDGSIAPLLAARGLHVSLPTLAQTGVQRAAGGSLLGRLPELVFTGLTSLATFVVDCVIVIVVCIWLLADGRSLRRRLLGSVPARPRSALAFGLDAIVVVVGGYVRAQLLMALLIGFMAALGCFGLGVPYPVVVGVVAAVFELIPIVGPFAGGAVALFLASTVSPVLMVWTLLLFLLIHGLEGYVLAPRIQARFVRIHPLMAFLALFAGIEVGGFLGALFAVPVASLLAVFAKTALEEWRARDPEAFAVQEQDEYLERRRKLLDEFTLLPPRHPLKRWWRSLAGPPRRPRKLA